MFRALIRWVKAIGFLLTGQVRSAHRVLDTNPAVLRARYDEIIREKVARIQQYQQAITQLVAQEQVKVQKVRDLNEEVARLTDLQAGALATAKQVTDEQRRAGKSIQDIKSDFDYQRYLAAYNDFSSTLAEKEERIQELESDVKIFRGSIDEHKAQLKNLSRELETLKAEASDAMAEIISARQEKEIADSLIGLSIDGASQELEELRDIRYRLKAEARVAKDTVGAVTRAQEDDFLAYASDSLASSEFDALLGLADETDAEASQSAPRAQGATLLE